VPGATSARGLKEYDFNLRLATLIEHQLMEAGFAKTVLLITDGKKMKSLADRVGRANGAGADLFLSIHHDSVPDKFLEKWTFEGEEHGYSDRFKGHSIFISRSNADVKGSLQFAKLLGKELKARDLRYAPHYTEKFMGHFRREIVDKDVGVYFYDKLIVLKDTRMPAALLEAGSIINRDEELVMGSPERQALISAAVTGAVDAFCIARQPRKLEQVARPAAPAPKASFLPASMAQPAKPGNAR
jgi:N-acetylmuramoyl-L-alanine amidase